MEHDLLNRLENLYGHNLIVGKEISAFNGLVKGHPDAFLFETPLDCKSVLMDDWIPKDRTLPNRIFWQMQSYMLYTNSRLSIVIFESRENGIIKVIPVYESKAIQDKIQQKLKKVVEAIQSNCLNYN